MITLTLYSIFGLSIAMFILAITPGPGVIATIAKALNTGLYNTTPLILGIIVGDLVFLLFAIFGLSLIATSFNSLFIIIKYLGALYLIYLGIKIWHSKPMLENTHTNKNTHKYSFISGLSITLGNPKVILFYLGFLPTFVNMKTLTNSDILIIAFIVSFILGVVMFFYGFLATKAKQTLKSQPAQNRLNKMASAMMVGAGTTLLIKN